MKGQDFLLKGFEKIVCSHFCLQIQWECFLILERIQKDIIINVHVSAYIVLVISDRFYSLMNFLHSFSKLFSNFIL